MLNRVETLKKEHGRLRVLLLACEDASAVELPGLLRQLHDAFLAHQRAKEQLYDAVVATCREVQDASTLTLLNVFRTNLTVMSNAVHGFFVHLDPDVDRLRQRFRTVTAAMRSLMDIEEKSVFPLCLRQHSRSRTALTMDSQILSPRLRQEGGR
ncbi:MAG TPA: hypothetical protein VF794_10385 [Archangium sp.]|jgi:glutamate racemase|uniref:hypothetical protein n=1 Tax=Archangium sp. TaxID=1872627 RepID=UPI002EDB17FA